MAGLRDQQWTVVIADDDAPMRALIRHAIARDDRLQLVGEARHGGEALEQVEARDPDLLLLDLAMPTLSGMEVLQALAGRSRPTVVVLTGLGDDGLVDRTLTAGAAAHLEKGDAFASLAERLVDVLVDGRQPAAIQDATNDVPTRATVTSAGDAG